MSCKYYIIPTVRIFHEILIKSSPDDLVLLLNRLMITLRKNEEYEMSIISNKVMNELRKILGLKYKAIALLTEPHQDVEMENNSVFDETLIGKFLSTYI